MENMNAMPDHQIVALLKEIGSQAACCGCYDDLISLMREDAAIYYGRGAGEVELLRAHVMVRIASAGHADVLLPYVLEELETSLNVHAIAAAARVARGVFMLPPEMPRLLAAAIGRIRHVDQFVQFDTFPHSTGGATTAVDELVETLVATGIQSRKELMVLAHEVEQGAYLPPRASTALREALRTIEEGTKQSTFASHCCAGKAPTAGSGDDTHETPDDDGRSPAEMARPAGSIASLFSVELENQDGTGITFEDLFKGRPGVIGFFYTRCMNPNKCSRTISKLAALSRQLRQLPLHRDTTVAAISYDPAYDDPARLRRYGHDRRWPFGSRCQLLRTTGCFTPVMDTLQLGVGYGLNTVNRHRIELMVIDSAGTIRELRLRRLWEEDDILQTLNAIASS